MAQQIFAVGSLIGPSVEVQQRRLDQIQRGSARRAGSPPAVPDRRVPGPGSAHGRNCETCAPRHRPGDPVASANTRHHLHQRIARHPQLQRFGHHTQRRHVGVGAGAEVVPVENLGQFLDHGIVESKIPGGVGEIRRDTAGRGQLIEDAEQIALAGGRRRQLLVADAAGIARTGSAATGATSPARNLHRLDDAATPPRRTNECGPQSHRPQRPVCPDSRARPCPSCYRGCAALIHLSTA